MIYSPETNAVLTLTLVTLHLITLLQSLLEDAHSVHTGSSSSCPTHPSFFFLLHVASFLAGSWLLIFLPAWGGARPSLIPFPWADPISLRSQAMPYSHVGHNIDNATLHFALSQHALPAENRYRFYTLSFLLHRNRYCVLSYRSVKVWVVIANKRLLLCGRGISDIK
jgi:hypothetical protein